uniref:Imidazoleglycerol-phosphate dehydratase n=1 Tax=Fagus sylvatica TaxID=28930 RepID=A0A2N9EQE9_FAGSY
MELAAPPHLLQYRLVSSPLLKPRVRVSHRFLTPTPTSISLNHRKLLRMNTIPISCAASAEDNGSTTTTASPIAAEIVTNFSVAWIGEVKRVTKETNVSVKINLDGSAVADNNTRTPFLDHMLDV